jgi:hypothetical protein
MDRLQTSHALKEALRKQGFLAAAKDLETEFMPLDQLQVALRAWGSYPECLRHFPVKITRRTK